MTISWSIANARCCRAQIDFTTGGLQLCFVQLGGNCPGLELPTAWPTGTKSARSTISNLDRDANCWGVCHFCVSEGHLQPCNSRHCLYHLWCVEWMCHLSPNWSQWGVDNIWTYESNALRIAHGFQHVQMQFQFVSIVNSCRVHAPTMDHYNPFHIILILEMTIWQKNPLEKHSYAKSRYYGPHKCRGWNNSMSMDSWPVRTSLTCASEKKGVKMSCCGKLRVSLAKYSLYLYVNL